MKILMVSIFSNHFFNWTELLKDSNHEIYWIDVLDMDTQVAKIDFVKQITGWRNRYEYPGRYWIKHNLPIINRFINYFNHRSFIKEFKKILSEIQPDVVHSFEMYSSTAPILSVMQKNSGLKWIYSAWGNDYYYSQHPERSKIMKDVFARVDYLLTDCYRDFRIASDLGFAGEYLGKFPGGGGYELEPFKKYNLALNERKVILLKGYQNKFGRCNYLIEALYSIKNEISDFQIVVFGATKEVFSYTKKLHFPGGLKVYGNIGREKVFELLGQSYLYLGNSISDGMPNTLLEATIMDCFPIQSNPGGATAELIIDGKNGLLIKNPEDIKHISNLVLQAIRSPELIKNGIEYNEKNIKPFLAREYIREQVKLKYGFIQDRLN